MGTPLFSWGYGIATVSQATNMVLDTWFPDPQLGEPPANFDPLLLPAEFAIQEGSFDSLGVARIAVSTVANLREPPRDTSDAYLRLHLLSHCLATPNSLNLEGIFRLLPKTAFTNRGPISPEFWRKNMKKLMDTGTFIVCLDKFPPLLHYVTPPSVRIADASRVRLGAHLAPGTTVMHEGFVNFNAGTLGSSMVEGRVSQGVTIGEGTDIGGGASIMGTLSGGGAEIISVGKGCLLGANSGIGISLGDNCIVEAGLYVTAGTKVEIVGPDSDGEVVARDLSGAPNLLFRRNSMTGSVQALRLTPQSVRLNSDLHE